MLILIFCNKWNLAETFLLKVRDYFSRAALLHFIGNNPGKKLCEKVGTMIVCTPIVVSVPAIAGYVLDKEAQTGNHAFSAMESFRNANPGSSQAEQYEVYSKSYKSHANNSIVGRQLTKAGVMEPAAPEAIIPNYNTGLAASLNNIKK
jgi:hypothetical protein